MEYKRFKNDELVQFINDRGLIVDRTHRSRMIKGLKHADKNPEFHRFLDLPPEVRNNVYEWLLIFRSSWECHPNILRTSKQVHREASSILYGDNLIDVRIHRDGVYVHGKLYGTYKPRNKRFPCTAILWPPFLRRAQFVRISASPDDPHSLPTQFWRTRQSSIAMRNVLHSFTLTVGERHQLRQLQLDLRLLGLTDEELSEVLYPLRAMRVGDKKLLKASFVPAKLDFQDFRMSAPKASSASEIAIIRECYDLACSFDLKLSDIQNVERFKARLFPVICAANEAMNAHKAGKCMLRGEDMIDRAILGVCASVESWREVTTHPEVVDDLQKLADLTVDLMAARRGLLVAWKSSGKSDNEGGCHLYVI